MKQIIAIALSLSLTACSLEFTNPLLVSTPNPITQKELYQVESGLIVATEGLIVYKQLCIRKAIDRSCRDVVAHLQAYTRGAKPVLKNLRIFVRNNDQVNALIAYNTLKQITEDLKRETPVVGAQ
jgi:hypothetical protein